MRLPTKSPFVHFRFSDGAQILMHSRGRSKAARANMSAIARRASILAHPVAGAIRPCATITVLADWRSIYSVSDADATRISREVSAMMAEGRAESGEGR